MLGNTEGQLVYFANIGTDASPQFNGSQLLQAVGTVIDLSGIPRSRPFVADVNGDGVPDMLVGALDGLVRQYIGSRTSGATGSTAGNPGGAYAYALRVESPTNPWQCPVFPLDVNHDGLITPLDALIVINYLNEHGPGMLPVPVMLSFLFLIIVVGISYQLSDDQLRANRLSQELQETQQRMSLAAEAADLGLWEWDIARDAVWTTERGRALFGFGPGESLTLDRFLDRVHPDDRGTR